MPNTVRVASATLVGRAEELRSTLAVLRDLREGRPGVVLVSGRAGIGKTRFVTAVAGGLRPDGVRVLAGACLDLGSGAPPYSALVAAFRSVDPPAVQVLDALTGAIDMRRSRLFELLRSTTVALARRRPTVLVVEDLHWSDRITRDALLYLTAMAREGRWALVVTSRPDEVSARPAVREFLDALHRDAPVSVTLDALSPQDVAAQIAGIVGERPSTEHAERLHRRSGGVPLLVEEVLAAEAAGTTAVPGHLRDLFLARVGQLGVPAARAVEVAALVGGRCDERLIAEILGTDRAEVAAALDRAVVADVLVPDGHGYRMRHELLREAVDGALPAARRRDLHARIATVLAAVRHPDAAALAHHWYEADDPARAAPANLDAAALAERVHAPGEVHTYLERVLEHFDALPTDRAAGAGGRGALLARAAEAAHLSGDFGQAVALARDCLGEVDAPAVMAVRWERLARYCWVGRDGACAQRAHERSVAVLPHDASAHARVRVWSGYGWYLAMAGRTSDARGWSQQALDAADAGRDSLGRCRALLAWGYARSDDEPGLAALRQARDLAVAVDAGEELARAHAALDLSLHRHGRTAEREPVLRDGLRYVATHGLGRSYAPVLNYLLAELLLDLGRWNEADETLEELAARGVSGVPAMFTHAYRARLAAARGRTESAAACTARVAALAEDPAAPADPALDRPVRARRVVLVVAPGRGGAGVRRAGRGHDHLATAARIRLDVGVGNDGPAAIAAELGLTHRELEILPFLAAGRTNAEIADAFVISPRTVGVHVSRILQKLGATRRTEAANIARRRGLVSD